MRYTKVKRNPFLLGAKMLDHVVQEDAYNTPPYETILQTPKRKFPYISKIGRDLVGFHAEHSHKGNLLSLRFSDGRNLVADDLLLPAEGLVRENDNGLTYVSLDSEHLDIIVKCFGERVCRELLEKGHSWKDGVSIWYTSCLSLTLRRGKDTVRFYGLSSWAKGGHVPSLLNLAGISIPQNLDQQATKAEEVGWKLLHVIEPHLPPATMDLSSPSTLTTEFLLDDFNKLSIRDVPPEAQQLAYECLHAPWIEMLQMGTAHDSYDYDLNSAYPFEIARLLNIDRIGGDWKEVDEYNPRATYGFYRALINIKPHAISPIRFRKHFSLYSPYGSWIGYITQGEIGFLKRTGLGDVQVFHGWTFVPKERLTPFRATFERLLNLRQRMREEGDQLSASLLKLATARACGKFLQRIPKVNKIIEAGQVFCPIYACEVMTQTKLRLAELAWKQRKDVMSITVDGLLMSKSLRGPIDTGLKTEASGVASTVFAPLIAHVPGKLSQFDLLDHIERYPNARYLDFGSERRLTMIEALDSDNFYDAGKTIYVPMTLSMWHYNKRYWGDGLPRRSGDLLTGNWKSAPLMVEEIMLRRERR